MIEKFIHYVDRLVEEYHLDEDARQELYLCALECANRSMTPNHTYRTIKSKLNKLLRPTEQLEPLPLALVDEEDFTLAIEDRDLLRALLECLTPLQFQVFYLHSVERVTMKAISQRYGITLGYVHRLYSRAGTRCRQHSKEVFRG